MTAERVDKGYRTALEEALEAWGEVQAEQSADQGDLFDDEHGHAAKLPYRLVI